jgi:hypothetical protein
MAALVDEFLDQALGGSAGEIVAGRGFGAGKRVLILDQRFKRDFLTVGAGRDVMQRHGGCRHLLRGRALVGHHAEAKGLKFAADLPVHEGGELRLFRIIGLDRAVNRDGAALLGIVPMRAKAILANEVTEARAEQPQQAREGDVIVAALASGRTAIGRCVQLLDFGDDTFQRRSGLRHWYSPGWPEGTIPCSPGLRRKQPSLLTRTHRFIRTGYMSLPAGGWTRCAQASFLRCGVNAMS